jgi:hypothetical protein
MPAAHLAAPSGDGSEGVPQLKNEKKEPPPRPPLPPPKKSSSR